MNLYACLREMLGIGAQTDERDDESRHQPDDGVFLIRHRNPDGTVSYEATEELMKAAALAASRVPPPDFSKPPA